MAKKNQTGADWDQIKNTLATSELFRGFGTLILPGPDPTRN